MKRKTYKLLILILSFVCFLSVAAATSFAYFSSDLKINGYANVKIELLFERYDEEALNNYIAENNMQNTLTSADSVWGHKGNPYLISETRHLYNLSVLQNVGYFYSNFISKNYEGETLVGNTNYSDGYDVPYFVIANPDGTPAVIDATTSILNPIGTDEYPFIGSITGVSDKNNPVSFVAGGEEKTTTTSAIHNVTVKTNKSSIDHGLFGIISFLGDESKKELDESTGLEVFDGFVSTISNVLFSDVQVVVGTTTTVWEQIIGWANHLFYGKTFNIADTSKDPCETNHLGIIAGHVEYAKMSALSVYYSSNEIIAMDLQDAGQKENGDPLNYATSTGFIGFMYNLNPVVNQDGSIIAGSGLDSADISYGYEGGGGLSSGVLPGYIRAEEMYDTYGYYAVQNNNETTYQKQTGDLYIIKAYDKTGVPLATAVEDNYYYTDGVFTFALSGGQNPNSATPETSLDSIESIWKNSYVDDIQLSSNGWGLEQETDPKIYQYKQLKQVDTIEKGANYYIGHIDENGTFRFMNLLENGTTITAETSLGTLKQSADGSFFGLRYDSIDDRDIDEKYTITITEGTSKTNSNNEKIETYNFTSTYGSKYSLGITRSWFLIYLYGMTCSTIGSNGNADYDLTLTKNDDGSWLLGRLDTTNGEDRIQGIGLSNNTFSTSWYGGESSTPIYIYQDLGDVNDVEETPLSYVPLDSNAISLPANQYVFWPQVSTSGAETKTQTTYEIKALSEIGWKDNQGNPLWQVVDGKKPIINKMFDIKQTVDWDLALSLGDWNFNIGQSNKGGTILAPVGSGAYQKEIYIPTGSIAFYINKVPIGGAKIRVIVKVPQSDILRELGLDSDSAVEDHYIGIWQGKEKNQSSWLNYSYFDIDDAYQKVELPRSHPLVAEGVKEHFINANGASTQNEYLTVTYDGVTYTTMLQGGHYLLAYEFLVEETGTYILAATDVRMQLAYCSVDGVASSGRDGTGGSLLGDIDFVYDNDANKVLLVTDGGTGENGVEDPSQYYYESFVLVHFSNIDDNGKLHSINSEKLSIYRWAGGTGEVKTNIDINVVSGYCSEECKHVLCSPIKSITDIITINQTKKE
ncbi:MAG: hypothetical protein J6V71_01285 [Clostridia bacterium]|nr:hypothetical protein [Clostridia bacterium]